MHQVTARPAEAYRMGARALLLAQAECADQVQLHEQRILDLIAEIGPHAESCGTCLRALRNDGLAVGCHFGRPRFRKLRHHERLLAYQERRQASELSGQHSLWAG